MEDFFSFRRMITPVLVQILFWIGLAGVVILGLVLLSRNALLGLGVLVVGPLIVRIYCEFLILFFRVNETLTDILHVLERTERTGSRTVAAPATSRSASSATVAPMVAAPRGWDAVAVPPGDSSVVSRGSPSQFADISPSPASGPPGTEVQAVLTGFAAGEVIQVRWTTDELRWALLEQVNASPTGSASLRFVVPSSAEAAFQAIEAYARGVRRASRMFEVTEPAQAS